MMSGCYAISKVNTCLYGVLHFWILAITGRVLEIRISMSVCSYHIKGWLLLFFYNFLSNQGNAKGIKVTEPVFFFFLIFCLFAMF